MARGGAGGTVHDILVENSRNQLPLWNLWKKTFDWHVMFCGTENLCRWYSWISNGQRKNKTLFQQLEILQNVFLRYCQLYFHDSVNKTENCKECLMIWLEGIVGPSKTRLHSSSDKSFYKIGTNIFFQFCKYILQEKLPHDPGGGGDCWAIHHKWVFLQPLKVNNTAAA